MELKDLGFKHIVLDEEAIPHFLRTVNFKELDDFSKVRRIHIIGRNAGELKNVVKNTGGSIIRVDKEHISTDITSLVRTKKHKFINWSKTLKVHPK